MVGCVQGSAGEPLAPAVLTAGDLHVEGNPAVGNKAMRSCPAQRGAGAGRISPAGFTAMSLEDDNDHNFVLAYVPGELEVDSGDSEPGQSASSAASGHDEPGPLEILGPGAVAADADEIACVSAAVFLADPEALLAEIVKDKLAGFSLNPATIAEDVASILEKQRVGELAPTRES